MRKLCCLRGISLFASFLAFSPAFSSAQDIRLIGSVDGGMVPEAVYPIRTKFARQRPNQAWRYALTWDGGERSEGFQVRISYPDQRNFRTWKTTTSPSFTFKGLREGARYLVQIRGVNHDGRGPSRGVVLRPGADPGSYSNYGFWILSAGGGTDTKATSIASEGVLQYYGGNNNGNVVVSMAAAPDGLGYWLLMVNGDIHAYGSAQDFGDCNDCVSGSDRFADIEAAPNGQGLWVLTAQGYVHAVGNVGTWGNCSPCSNSNPGVDLVPGPDSLGYWVLDAAGGIHAMGAQGSIVPNNEWDGVTVPGWGVNGNTAISVAMNTALTGAIVLTQNGQLLVDGDAPDYGQIGSLNNCTDNPDTSSCGRSILFTPDEQGVWVLDGDGNIHTEGDALAISSVPREAHKLVPPANLPPGTADYTH